MAELIPCGSIVLKEVDRASAEWWNTNDVDCA